MGDLGQQEPALDAAVFELLRFEWDGEGRLEVEGLWTGIRGTRFVRPTLVTRGPEPRRLLAALDHKPWEPAEGKPWLAAFPWEGGEPDFSAAELSVAPGVEVELPAAGGRGVTLKGAAEMKRRPGKRVPGEPGEIDDGRAEALVKAARLERERDEAVEQRRALARELETLRQSQQEAVSAARVEEREAAAEALADGASLRARVEEQRTEAIALRDAAFRERDEALAARVHAEEARDRAEAERNQAQRDRDRAVKDAQRDRDRAVKDAQRDRDRAVKAAEQARDKAIADAERALAARAQAEAERDRAASERDLANKERDAVISAHERGLPLRPPQPRFGPAQAPRSAVDVWLARGVAAAILLILVLVVLTLF